MSGLLQKLRALPPAAVDLAIALAVLVGHSVPFLYSEGNWTMREYWSVPFMAIPLLARRRYPMVVFVLVTAATIAYTLRDPNVPAQPVPYGWLAAIYTVAELSPRWQRFLAVGISLAPTFRVSPETFVRSAITALAAYAMGRAVLKHRENARLVAERERVRISRDMHDILAHSIAIMIVQAESGPFAVRASPERAIQAFRNIGEAGRDAQAQLRRLLDLQRDRAPQPTLDGIPDLVAAVPHAKLVVGGTPGPLPADTQVAAYRIVQEALTNMVKHAAATTGEVRLDWTEDTLVITVTDDGRGGLGGGLVGGHGGSGGGHGGSGVGHGGSGGGHGLDGMRERAAACGGSVSFLAGPGFTVEARLPR
ncbi:MAG: sensor histidine kinase [Nonomuraea sp.]|nr:sensor histidine kinase [Nonomuraea sp.]